MWINAVNKNDTGERTPNSLFFESNMFWKSNAVLILREEKFCILRAQREKKIRLL